MSVCLCDYFIITGRILAKIKTVQMTFVDFVQLASNDVMQKLFSVTLIYFTKVKNSNRNLPTAAHVHSSVTSASTALLRVALYLDTTLPIAANAHSSLTNTSLSQRLRFPFLSKVQMVTKLFMQICLHLYGTQRWSCSYCCLYYMC